MKEYSIRLVAFSLALLLFIGVVFGSVLVWQYFKVFSAEQTGKAEFVRADQNRKITIVEAVAENEAAISRADAQIKIAEGKARAEVERARGVAQANEIIGDSLKGNDEYLRYLYINGVTNNSNQIIYIPTEATLPVLEAGKR